MLIALDKQRQNTHQTQGELSWEQAPGGCVLYPKEGDRYAVAGGRKASMTQEEVCLQEWVREQPND